MNKATLRESYPLIHPVQVPRWTIFHRGFKINSKISAGKYEKVKFSGAIPFSIGERSKIYV